ncbi:hypothetical protein [Paenibacillus alginolyticus]|uniref:hypothetical protein n=1 Tax=Paenibacillus alginolyticus TaxID=59839 RepID=UPI001580CE36
MELLREMKQETTVLFSTHVLHDAEEISDDIMIMDQGHIVVEGDLSFECKCTPPISIA